VGLGRLYLFKVLGFLMSRRHFAYPHPQYGSLHIVSGWDRPLQGFFLTVTREKVLSLEGEPTFLFSNLDSDTFPPGMHSEEAMISLEQVRQVLTHHSIPTPVNYFLDLLEDARLNVGSLDHHYTLRERVR